MTTSFGEHLAAADLDEDGDCDLASGTRVWINDGEGSLRTSSNPMPVERVRSPLTLGDVDFDGDVDIFVSSRPAGVYSQVTRQVAWRAVPRIGQELRMDVYGTPPGSRWMLFAALGQRVSAKSRPGTLLLDPRTLMRVAAGRLDSEGLGTATFEVPPDPSLVGAEVWWQARVGRPARMTNLERTVFTNL